jgi:hypothetical protein
MNRSTECCRGDRHRRRSASRRPERLSTRHQRAMRTRGRSLAMSRSVVGSPASLRHAQQRARATRWWQQRSRGGSCSLPSVGRLQLRWEGREPAAPMPWPHGRYRPRSAGMRSMHGLPPSPRAVQRAERERRVGRVAELISGRPAGRTESVVRFARPHRRKLAWPRLVSLASGRLANV